MFIQDTKTLIILILASKSGSHPVSHPASHPSTKSLIEIDRGHVHESTALRRNPFVHLVPATIQIYSVCGLTGYKSQ